jgi:signal transduction histidine kinase
MRRIFRRSILWLVPVIFITLAVMLVMQYRFLRTLESTTVSAERNWLRGAVETAAAEIESYYRSAATRALTLPHGATVEPARLADHVRANPVRGAKTYFLAHFHNGMVRYDLFDATGWSKTIGEQELQAIKLATVSWHVVHKYKTSVPPPSVNVDERDPQNRVILRALTDEKMRVIGVAGVVLDEGLTRAAMTAIGKQSLRGSANTVTLRIGDRFPVMAAGRGFTTHSLGFVFTNWRAGIRGICGSPEEIAAYNFRMNSMYTGGAAVVFFAAVVLGLQAIARQSKLSQMKSDFVSNVSHELRTPLASIRVFGEYMRLGRVGHPDKIREYGEYIEAESRRLTQLINNILDFSKIESAEKKYKFVETDVADLVRQTVNAFAMPLREHGFTVTFRGPAAPLPPLAIDRDAIAQVVVNLLDNAVKYSKERKEIDVEVSGTREELRVSVCDRGIGIPASEQKKIFEKFYRVGSGLVHDVKGSGLGLAIVSHVVKAHGGRVEVVSQPSQGSTFSIVLNVGAPASAPAPIQDRTEFA